jgi:hypothetical protein
MRSYHWAKVWIEILDDSKMGPLPDRLWRRSIELILLAKEMDKNGFLPDVADMAWRLRTDPQTLESELVQLAAIGIVERHSGVSVNGSEPESFERWFVLNFAKRQGKMSAAERKARQRERAKAQGSHTGVTSVSHDGHDTVTYRDTREDKEEDKDKEEDPLSRNVTHTPNATYLAMLKVWGEQFPDKPQPRPANKTLQGKVRTRLKSAHFVDNWQAAMTRAGRSAFCQAGGWFDFGWFVKNDDNYEKCLNGNYDDGPAPDRRGEAFEPLGFQGVRQVMEELQHGVS